MGSVSMVVSTIFAGHLGDERKQAAMGIGNSLTFIFLLTACFGANRALDTLHTTAYGAGNLKLCGTYLNRGRYVMTLVYLPAALLIIIF